MRILFSAFLLTAVVCSKVHAQPAKTREIDNSRLLVTVATEDARPAKVKIEIQTSEPVPKTIKSMDDLSTGSTELSLSAISDGKYFVFFSAPSYASRWSTLVVKAKAAEPNTLTVQLFRKRYVVLRYAFNKSGGRELSGKGVVEGRAAVAHWQGLPEFNQDWQIWQRSSSGGMFGETPFLEFHRFSDGFGFAPVPRGAVYEDLKKAPAAGYKCENIKAKKGLLLFCRVEGNQKSGLGYGKIFVEDVTEEPPSGIKVVGQK